MRSLNYLLALIFFVEALGSCAPDAPHDNPLDPGSPSHKADDVLSGIVMSLGLHSSGVQNALVAIQENGAAQYTDANGDFSFADAPSGNLTLIVSKPSYKSDTIEVSLTAGGSLKDTMYLDPLPQISDAQVVTSKIDQWWPAPVYSALVTAVATAPDGLGFDTSSVFVTVDSLIFKMYSSDAKNWQTEISSSQLPNQDLQWLIGKEFIVYAKDQENGTGQSTGFYVTRLIEAEVNLVSPTNLDTATGHPRFTWSSPTLSFDYGYQLQIYQVNSGTQTPVGSPISVSSDSISYTYADSLVPGQYSWTITIVDDFNNSSTSKEASFQVQ